MNAKLQWIKPILPGSIPDGHTPMWNDKTEEWEFVLFEQASPEPEFNPPSEQGQEQQSEQP